MAKMLEPRKFGDFFYDTFGIYKKNFLKLIAIVAIAEGILFILGYFFLLSLPLIITEGKIVFSILSVMVVIIAVILVFLSVFVVFPLMEGALIYAISEQYFRQPVSIRQAYRFAMKRLKSLIGSALLALSAVFGMAMTIIGILALSIRRPYPAKFLGIAITIIGIPAVIYFGVRWIFIFQAVSLEDLGARAALSRSSALVKGNWWEVFAVAFVLSIITGMISNILGTIPAVGTAIGFILSTPVSTIMVTLLYCDLRLRKEGYSLEMLAEKLHIK